MAEPTAPDVPEAERYQPCGKCRRCTSGALLGVESTPDDCFSRYLDRMTGVTEPETTTR